MSKRNTQQPTNSNGEKKRPGRPKKPTTLNNLLNNEIDNVPDTIPDTIPEIHQDDMEAIIKEISEREMRMAMDESFAHAIATSNVDIDIGQSHEPELSEILENIRLMEEIENKAKINNPTHNLITEQDEEYEEALRQDMAKERRERIDERNRLEQEEMEKAIQESLELAKKNIPIPETIPTQIPETIQETHEEEVPLTKEQLRLARLAFFNKKN